MESGPNQFPNSGFGESPRSNASERGGIIDRWRRREKTRRSESEPKPQRAESLKDPEKIDRPKVATQRERFTESVGRVLFGDRQKDSEREESAQQQPVVEQQTAATPETASLIDRATRMRRFAGHVITSVLRVASRESTHGREWDRGRVPLDTEPLIDAAEDLGDAVDDLDSAAHEYGGYSEHRRDAREPSPAASVTEFMSRRIEELERRVQDDAERHEAKVTALRTGVGIIAVAGVILAGHEYLVHKKIRKDQKQLRAAVAERKIENLLQKEQIEEMTRRERAAHYERLAKITHKQADVTREVASDLHEEARVLQIVRGSQTSGEQSVEWRRSASAERVAAKPESLTAPAATVEMADTVEQGPAGAFNHDDLSQQIVGMNAAGYGVDASGRPVGTVPLSPAAQKRLAERKARAERLAANAWIYGLMLVGGLLVIGLAVVFFG